MPQEYAPALRKALRKGAVLAATGFGHSKLYDLIAKVNSQSQRRSIPLVEFRFGGKMRLSRSNSERSNATPSSPAPRKNKPRGRDRGAQRNPVQATVLEIPHRAHAGQGRSNPMERNNGRYYTSRSTDAKKVLP
jgi:hypothetical protein